MFLVLQGSHPLAKDDSSNLQHPQEEVMSHANGDQSFSKLLETFHVAQCTCMHIAPHSGLTVHNDVTALAGVIDPDYRGEIKVTL